MRQRGFAIIDFETAGFDAEAPTARVGTVEPAATTALGTTGSGEARP